VVSYAPVAELKAYDSSVTASDGEIQAALDFATALATARARRTFSVATATAVTVNDVRTRNVVVDLPFANVTAVAVDGDELPTSCYVVEPWGIRLLSGPRIDFDGYGPSVEPWGGTVALTEGKQIPPWSALRLEGEGECGEGRRELTPWIGIQAEFVVAAAGSGRRRVRCRSLVLSGAVSDPAWVAAEPSIDRDRFRWGYSRTAPSHDRWRVVAH
jgi:hypothetical protein